MPKIKILTMNTHKGFSWFNRKFILPELRDALRSVNPDIVFLQEVLGEHKLFSRRYTDTWPENSHYEFLADEIWDSHAYGRNAVYDDGHHGNAILSRYPIDQWHNYDISLNGIERRGLLYCHIQLGDHQVHAICVHLSLREPHRQIQLQKLSDLIHKLPKHDPLIVAGDFNDWRQKAHDVLQRNCDLVELFRAQCGKPLRTFPAKMPILRLDRIYARNIQSYQLQSLAYQPWAKLSDHKPLLAEITL